MSRLREKTTATLLIAIFMISIFVVAIPIASADTLTVGNGGTYSTIQAAIDAASPYDTIVVAAGTYAEVITVTKSVTLLGANHDVDPAGSLDRSGESVISGGTMTIKANDVTVNGFKMTGGYIAAGYPLALDVTISYNILVDISAPWGAIHLHPTHQCDGGYVGYNTISGVTGHGIWTVSNDDVTIEHNYILDISGTGIDILNHIGTGIEILENTITNPGQKGINYWAGPGGLISGNTITGSGWEAIFTDTGVTIEKNHILDAGIHGIVAAGHVGTEIEILENTIIDPVYKGINYWAGPGGLISGNTITGSGWEAIFTDTKATMRGNTVSNCFIGIQIYPPAYDVVIQYNNIYQNLYGLINYAFDQVDATLNWWGDTSGPYHQTTNPDGLGDDVNDNVDYSPWLGATFETTPRTYHVNPTGTIQAAVDAAVDGDTIIVHAGVYSESVSVVGFTSLTIQAEGAGHLVKMVTVNPTPSGATNGFTVYSDGVTIEGFEICDTNFGIWFEGSENKFSNNYIHDIESTTVWDDGGVGICLWDSDGGSDYNEITNNRIEDIERTGILLDVAWTAHIITGNSIAHNEISSTPWGSIEVLNAEYTSIHHNILHDCGDWGIALLAVYGIESNYNVIAHNKITGSTNWFDIMVYPFYGGVASHNKIHHNTASTYTDYGTDNRDFKNSWN